MKRKTSIQFAYLGKQIVCFLCLFAGANYDLNSNSVCWPRFSIHLVRKSSDLQQEGYLLKMILQLIVSSCEIVSSIVFVIHYNPQLITGQLGSWKESAAKHMKEHCLPLESSLKRSLPFQNT